MKQVLFPTRQQAWGEGRLFGRCLLDFPMSLVKLDGTWTAVSFPAQTLLEEAERFYLGGYTYALTDAEAADLPASYVQEVP